MCEEQLNGQPVASMNAEYEENDYEHARLVQIAANRAKLAEIGLLEQVVAISKCARTPKTIKSRSLPRPAVTVVQRERSARAAGRQPVDYRSSGAGTHHDYDPGWRQPSKRRRTGGSGALGRPTPESVSPPYTASALDAAQDAAAALEQRLAEQCGSAAVGRKTMMKSLVSGGFWCQAPFSASVALNGCKGSVRFKLGDEGDAYRDLPASQFHHAVDDSCPATWDVIWLPRGKESNSGVGFSGNWRGFALDQQLKVGDVVVWEVFQGGYAFRVFVFRAGCYETRPDLRATALRQGAGNTAALPVVCQSPAGDKSKDGIGNGGRTSKRDGPAGSERYSGSRGEADWGNSRGVSRSRRSGDGRACEGDRRMGESLKETNSSSQPAASESEAFLANPRVIRIAKSARLADLMGSVPGRKASTSLGGRGKRAPKHSVQRKRHHKVSTKTAAVAAVRKSKESAADDDAVALSLFESAAAVDAVADAQEYRVRGLKAVRGTPGRLEWLVCWEGYDNPCDDTWEVEDNLMGNAPAAFKWLGAATDRPAEMRG